jgi:hypothetical protein
VALAARAIVGAEISSRAISKGVEKVWLDPFCLQAAVLVRLRGGPGPAFHVYLVPKASIRSSSDLKDAKFVDLGGLRSFKGSQRYAIPPGVNPKDYQTVIIWCERFGVLIPPADLTSAMAAR